MLLKNFLKMLATEVGRRRTSP